LFLLISSAVVSFPLFLFLFFFELLSALLFPLPRRPLGPRAPRRNIVESDVERMLSAHLRPGWVVDEIERQHRPAEALLDIGRPVRILLRVGPPRVGLDEFWHDRQPTAEPALQILGMDFRLDDVL